MEMKNGTSFCTINIFMSLKFYENYETYQDQKINALQNLFEIDGLI